ncbi:MAG: hypothetical protein ACFWT7_00190 [Succiniclasticum sp.]|jgi:DNA-binding transcriptional LysR family regulator
MNDRAIEAFLAIVTTKNFQKAAELLNLTQSTVSHRLKDLEEEMGTPLISRTRGRTDITLTNAGEHFLPLAIRWQQLSADMDKIKEHDSYPESLVIGGLDSVKDFILLPFLRALRERCPNLQIKLVTGSSTSLYEMIATKGADIGFVQFDIRKTYVHGDFFCREEFLVVSCSANKFPLTVSAKDLDPTYECRIDWGAKFNRWHEDTWGINHKSMTLCDTLFELRGILKDSNRWALVPASSAHWFLKDGLFTVSRIDPMPPERVISMIYHEEPRAEARGLLTVFKEILRDPDLQHKTDSCVMFGKF